jgi:hypothetical protein
LHSEWSNWCYRNLRPRAAAGAICLTGQYGAAFGSNWSHSSLEVSAKCKRIYCLLITSYRWRSFTNDRRDEDARGFIDGDLIESFLDLSAEDMDKLVKDVNSKHAMNLTVSSVIDMVEDVARIH